MEIKVMKISGKFIFFQQEFPFFPIARVIHSVIYELILINNSVT